MIVPMQKYSFLVYHREIDHFLRDLMELGVVHLLPKGSMMDDYTLDLETKIREAEQILKKFEKRKVVLRPVHEAGEVEIFPIVSEVSALELEFEEISRNKITYAKQVELLEPWGTYSLDLVKKLKEKAGVFIKFFEYPERKFDKNWENEYALEVISRSNGKIYFIIFLEDESQVLPIVPSILPTDSLEDSLEKLKTCEHRIKEINEQLNDYVSRYHNFLKERIVEAKDILRFHVINQNLNELEEHRLTLLEGWCPKIREKELIEHLEKENIVYLEIEPEEGEVAPVLLKNNAFARLFEPIGNMFSLPAYSEMDLTPFFAPFFLLFFGFCLGDAGYGVVMLLAATIAKFFIKKIYLPIATLLQFFGLATLVIGFFSGTLFGLEMVKLSTFEPVRNLFFSQGELFNLALAIGFVQIIVGMAIQVYKKIKFEGWIHGLSNIGWIILLLSLIDIALFKKALFISSISVWVGVAMVVLFGSPSKGILKSIGFGMADLYNITGVMGDLLSYIRLFALGVSSAILGLVVNNIAFSAKGIPYVGIVAFVLILVIGHGANLMLASLSAFVHPMRLTFVEFYKNTGFLGGGKPYDPFSKKIKEFKKAQE